MGATCDSVCNNIIIGWLLAGVIAISITCIIIAVKNDGDKNQQLIGFREASQARGTLTAIRVDNEMEFHVLLESLALGAVVRIAVHGPTGDPPLPADPGPELLRLCGTPADACSQVSLTKLEVAHYMRRM